MSELTPCPSCQRHVRRNEASCPFCAQALSLADLPAHVLPRSRLGRAATFAFGATLAGATALLGCGGESEGKKAGGGGAASGGSAAGGAVSGGSAAGGAASGGSAAGGVVSFGSGQLMYGSPPFDEAGGEPPK